MAPRHGRAGSHSAGSQRYKNTGTHKYLCTRINALRDPCKRRLLAGCDRPTNDRVLSERLQGLATRPGDKDALRDPHTRCPLAGCHRPIKDLLLSGRLASASRPPERRLRRLRMSWASLAPTLKGDGRQGLLPRRDIHRASETNTRALPLPCRILGACMTCLPKGSSLRGAHDVRITR